MKDLNRELETLIKDMNSVDKLTDDLFIQYFEKEEAMQEKLEALKKANKLSAEEYATPTHRPVATLGRPRGKLELY